MIRENTKKYLGIMKIYEIPIFREKSMKKKKIINTCKIIGTYVYSYIYVLYNYKK